MLDLAPSERWLDAPARALGSGRLRVARVGSTSVVTEARATSPLKWLTPRSHGGAAWVFASTYGGGLVDGDAVMIEAAIERHACAMLSTQASTKIYRSARGTSLVLRAGVESGATLVVLPDPNVCFAGSSYSQTQHFSLVEGASLVYLDWMTSGRRARGERWAFRDYRSRLSIDHAGQLICHDAVTLSSTDMPLSERFGHFDVWATVAIVGERLRDDWTQALEMIAGRPLVPRADCLVAGAALGDVGVLARVAGRSVEDVGHAVQRILTFVPRLLGDNPWARKW